MESGDLEESVGFNDMLSFDYRVELDLGDGLRQTDDGFELTHCDRDAARLLADLLVFGVLSVIHVQVLQHVTCFFRKAREDLHFSIGNILPEILECEFSISSYFLYSLEHMEVNDMVGNGLISRVFSDVLNNENAVESGEDRALEVNLFSGVFQVVISSEDGVRCCQN